MDNCFERMPRCKITLRCNYKCPYCPVIKSSRSEISGEEWVEIIKKYDTPEVVLEGGEPTIHKGFLHIVNNVGKDKLVRIYTNGSFKKSLIDSIEVNTAWYVSYHPKQGNTAEEVASNCRYILDKGHRLINVHTNEGPPTASPDEYRIFSDYGLQLLTEHNLYCGEKWKRYKRSAHLNRRCVYPRVYIDPCGERYICVGKLECADRSGIIPHDIFPGEAYCEDTSLCSVCDIAVLT